MSAQIQTATTAGIYPEKFSDDLFFTTRRRVVFAAVLLFLLIGGGLRVWNLGAESLSEDELNKLQTVADYRANGLSGRNGEHPFLMKGLQTVSLTLADKLNSGVFSENKISDEAALRFPTAMIGTLTILLLFLLVSELFGTSIGLIAAALWAVDPSAIGFDRIAKEDSFLLCFFVLTAYFWIRGQTLAERATGNWMKYLWLAAAAWGAMLASKYLPHLIAVVAAYYQIFQSIPKTKWRLGKIRWLQFLAIAGAAFLIFNPTILLPDTWREMLTFSGEKRIGHDSYEFMGALYRNQLTTWLAGVPWTFYYVFILFKMPLLTLACFFAGISAIFRRQFGDGRWFVFFWAVMWFLPFTFLGGKFTRYFTVAEPIILIVAAIGFYTFLKWLMPKISVPANLRQRLAIVCFAVLIGFSIFDALSYTPHFRLYTNTLGGGRAVAGFYFPHDEFYDTSTREIVHEIVSKAENGAVIANETPVLFEHYFKQAGRADLISVPLSDKSKTSVLNAGDFIVAARGRRYFSNDVYLQHLATMQPFAEIAIDGISSAKIYRLNEVTARIIAEAAR